MKKISLILVFVLILQLCGCGLGTTLPHIQTLKGWYFQYNQGTNDYSIFFGLLTKSDRYVSADVNVDVRIVNDDGTEVYKATHAVTKDDFDHYTSQIAGEEYLANLRIPASALTPGTSASGTVYLTVYKDDLRFDEVNCTAYFCLPVLDIQVVADGLPVELDVKEYDGRVSSKIRVEEVTYTYDKEYTSTLLIAVAGTKTYGGTNSSYDTIGYKIYDSEGYVVHSGTLFLSNLSEGDRFRDETIMVFDVTPGETYTIRFSEDSW